ncbi:hypothetical protein [Acidihalobacter ferrooxydans]|uniref:Uncharacterized protein n=1 Tax=Acidihalobacter ferrooxydans TaxID=1765967 RepID=A0A1P8UI20_9GAMM|nr:hypothetical protein [Acidihalobacter ferrooxydans]APZ43480.1 hypothetical protein BW247_10585 [Acidihalobacter ferrooxydans]
MLWVWAILLLSLSSVAAAAGNWVQAPPLPALTKPNDLAVFALQNTSKHRTRTAYLTFGTVFAPNALRKPMDVTARLGTGVVPVQIDPKTHYPDGSIRFSVVTVQAAPLAPQAIKTLELIRKPASPVREASAVSVGPVLRNYDPRVVLTFYSVNGKKLASPKRMRIDLLSLYQHARAKADDWRRGPLATEIRLQHHVLSSLRLVADVTAYANGALSADIQFCNDIAMSPKGGTLVYSARLLVNGKTVYDSGRVTQYQYQTWHSVWHSAGWPPINVVHDVPRLAALEAIPNYQTLYGLPAEGLRGELKSLRGKGWGKPLANNGVTQYMPMTGGRPDIGPVTGGNAIWLITQNPVAAAFALGQADAAGAVPWHFYLPSKGHYLTTLDYPDMWADPRGGPYSYTTGLTQPYRYSDGWHPGKAHMPSLAYIPYLLTGRRYYLDQLNAEALYAILGQWPSPRQNGKGILVGTGAQVRGAAWSLREVAYAAWANPADSYFGRYFRKILLNNVHYMEQRIPEWTRAEGEAYGYVPGTYGHSGAMAPWQQDFFATTMATIARLGIPGAKRVLQWQTHFLAGSLQPQKGWNPRDGIAYNLFVYNPKTKQQYKTWAKIRKVTEAMGQANGNGWKHSRGYYGMVRLAALASIYNVDGSREALSAYQWLAKSGAPFISKTSRAGTPQYWIVPMGE